MLQPTRWLRRQWWWLTLPHRDEPLPALDPPAADRDEAARIRELLEEMDSPSADVREAVQRRLPQGDLTPFFLEAFPRTRRMEARISMVFKATFYARESESAFRLGLLALDDRSKYVRERGCGVLAYSLRREALPKLRRLLRDPDSWVRENAEAAVDAIKRRNHHLFVDQDWPRGQTFWIVRPGDDPSEPDVGLDPDPHTGAPRHEP
jgi:HEAT repeats